MTSTLHHGAHEHRHGPSRVQRGAETALLADDVAARIIEGSRPRRTVLTLYARLIRRGALLMALALAAYVALEVAS